MPSLRVMEEQWYVMQEQRLPAGGCLTIRVGPSVSRFILWRWPTLTSSSQFRHNRDPNLCPPHPHDDRSRSPKVKRVLWSLFLFRITPRRTNKQEPEYENVSQFEWVPEQCEGSGAPGCASLASQVASPGRESCGWEVVVQRRQCSGPLAPAYIRIECNVINTWVISHISYCHGRIKFDWDHTLRLFNTHQAYHFNKFLWQISPFTWYVWRKDPSGVSLHFWRCRRWIHHRRSSWRRRRSLMFWIQIHLSWATTVLRWKQIRQQADLTLRGLRPNAE